MPSSPMGKTYLSTAVTEHGPRVYDVLRAYAGCNRLGTHVTSGTATCSTITIAPRKRGSPLRASV